MASAFRCRFPCSPGSSLKFDFAKVVVLASPLAISLIATPAEAALSKTFTGFTGVFGPTNWKPTQTGDGVGFLSASTMKLTATDSNPSGGFQYQFDSSKLNQPSSLPAGAAKFKSGIATFEWSWTFTNDPKGSPALGVIYPFESFVGTDVPVQLWSFVGLDPADPSQYITKGVSTFEVDAGEKFGFRISSTASMDLFSNSTGTITKFVFNADYVPVPVPGPLPVAGALAGFAWSRKLRRRLKAAKASA